MKGLWLRAMARPQGFLVVVALVLYAGLVASGCSPQKVDASAASEAAVREGREVFAKNCSVCHGEKGDRVPVAPLNLKEFLESRGDATLVTVIGEGKGVMPAWGKARGGPLTEEQVRSVVAYLNSTAGRRSSTLLAGQGRAAFEQNCVRCHGEKGDRIPVSPLSTKAFLDSRTDVQLYQVITDGKGMMPKFPLPEEQVRAIVAYLRYGAEASLAERARRGRELYLANCLSCHGERGERVSSTPLASSEYLTRLGDGGLISAIAEGKGEMPGLLKAKTSGASEIADVAAILAYLKSWAGLPAGLALTGPRMPNDGQALYTKDCTGCHGENGDRVQGVRLKARDFLDARSDQILQQLISQGNGRGMPAWGQSGGGPLSDAAVQSIVKYLRSTASGPAAAAGTAAPAASAAPQAPVSEAALAKGKELFTKSCVACHGETRDKIPTARLADGAWLKEKSDATLTHSITNGKGPMPAWGKAKGGPLSDEDVTAVLAYLKSAAGVAQAAAAAGGAAPQAPAASAAPQAPAGGAAPQAPVGEAALAKGKELYTKSCVACHGETRDKIPTCKLADGAWLKEKGDATLTQSITNGKGPMPSWGKAKGGPLSDEDVTAVLAYLKSAAGVAQAAAGTAAPAPAASGPALTSSAVASDPTQPMVEISAGVGRELYTKSCAACHGEDGMRQPNGPLGAPGWLAEMNDESLRLKIAFGKPSLGMPTWSKGKGGPLSDSQIRAIMAYLPELGAANARKK